ncbi:MAG: hypothetical protein KJ749_00415 [Planctomycetes bacterium]|nr:hypothetical protein [Planctomycetota bacterium]
MTAAQLSPHLRRMETLPTFCVLYMWLVALGVVLLWFGLYPGFVLLSIPALTAWGFVFHEFGKACHFKTGWISVLSWYHLAGLTQLCLWIVLGFATVTVSDVCSGAGWNPDKVLFCILGALIAVGTLLKWKPRRQSDNTTHTRGVYCIARDKLHVFSREFVVEQARKPAEEV